MRQSNSNHRINRSIPLTEEDICLLHQLDIDRVINQPVVEEREEDEEVPMLVEEDAIEVQVENRLENEQVLQEQEQQLPPYQLTLFYQQQQLLFDEQLNNWVRQYKEEQLLQFNLHQQQLYEEALLIGAPAQQYVPDNNAVDYDHCDNLAVNNVDDGYDYNVIIDEVNADDIIIILMMTVILLLIIFQT